MKTVQMPFFRTKCSTWNTYFVIYLSALLIACVGCEKKDPKPELKDLIYQDMIAQLAESERISKETEVKIEDVRKSVADAKAQTGMRQRAERQIIEMEKLRIKLNQQSLYWKIRAYERLKHVRIRASGDKGEYKPDPSEWSTYSAEKKLRMAKNAWDLKARFKETGFEYDPVLMGESPATAPVKTPPPAANGGGH